MNAQRWVTISYVLLSLIMFFIFDQALSLVWDLAGWSLHEEWPISVSQIVALLLSVVLYVSLSRMVSVNTFMKEVVIELSKVTWPEKKETIQSAIVVIIMVAFMSVILFFIDSLWGSLTQRLLVN